MRSKAVWGYPDAFIEACRPVLTVRAEAIEAGLVQVVDADGVIGGFYALRKLSGERCELDLLFVEPDFIGQGLGARLYRHALVEAGRLGWTSLEIESDPGAEAFYLRMGARRVGTRASTVEPGRELPVLETDVPPTPPPPTPAPDR
jgi:GNAT superfamily N-acetyltransferase